MVRSVDMGTLDLVGSIFTGGVEMLEEMGEHAPNRLIAQLGDEVYLRKAMQGLSDGRMSILGDPESDRFVYVTPNDLDMPLKWAIRWGNLRGLVATEWMVIQQGIDSVIMDSKVKGSPAHLVCGEEQLFGTVRWPGYESFYWNGYLGDKFHPHGILKPGTHAIIMQASPVGELHAKSPGSIESRDPNLSIFYLKEKMQVGEIRDLLWLREHEFKADLTKSDVAVLRLPWSEAEALLLRQGKLRLVSVAYLWSTADDWVKKLGTDIVPKGTIVFGAKTAEERCMSCVGRKYDVEASAVSSKKVECKKCKGTGRIPRKGASARAI